MILERFKGLGTTFGFSAGIVAVAALALHFGANNAPVHAVQDTPQAAPSATFAGTGVGSIPDGPGSPTACGSDGTPLNISFNVTGISGPPSDVQVSMTFGSPIHTWAGDVTAILIAPNGASQTLFGYTGSTTAGGCGDSSDLAGPYNFFDGAAAPPSGGWWQAATAAGAAASIATGDYRTTNRGGAGATNPQPATSMNPTFSGIPTSNGTWTLRVIDGGGGDTGAVSAATLTLNAAAPPTNTQHVVDFDGDGKTDRAVVRNTGGGANGQVTWFVNFAGSGNTQAWDWGLAQDFFTPGDFDGDGKTDIAIWRPLSSGQPSGNAFFYVLNSATSTVTIEDFGQTGDDPTVIGDYNGDGKFDFAVYRAGAASGDQSTWFFKTAVGGAVNYQPWGVNGDFPAPGDYDGDGKADFAVQRNNGGGTAAFWIKQTTAGNKVQVFGTPTDVIVPGDYDGDGKTDIAVIRGSAGSINWWILRSSDSGVDFHIFGASATDFPTQGDYDGDGKTDPAVWRSSASPGASAFWYKGSTSGSISVPFGASGDYPVANYNSH